ncbi:hypothetical protein ACHAWF_004928, partial [Thalassiosira exigua]
MAAIEVAGVIARKAPRAGGPKDEGGRERSRVAFPASSTRGENVPIRLGTSERTTPGASPRAPGGPRGPSDSYSSRAEKRGSAPHEKSRRREAKARRRAGGIPVPFARDAEARRVRERSTGGRPKRRGAESPHLRVARPPLRQNNRHPVVPPSLPPAPPRARGERSDYEKKRTREERVRSPLTCVPPSGLGHAARIKGTDRFEGNDVVEPLLYRPRASSSSAGIRSRPLGRDVQGVDRPRLPPAQQHERRGGSDRFCGLLGAEGRAEDHRATVWFTSVPVTNGGVKDTVPMHDVGSPYREERNVTRVTRLFPAAPDDPAPFATSTYASQGIVGGALPAPKSHSRTLLSSDRSTSPPWTGTTLRGVMPGTDPSSSGRHHAVVVLPKVADQQQESVGIPRMPDDSRRGGIADFEEAPDEASRRIGESSEGGED